MIGLSELVVPGIILLLIALFGKKAFLNLYRDIRGIKKDMKGIDNEIKETNKDVKKEFNL